MKAVILLACLLLSGLGLCLAGCELTPLPDDSSSVATDTHECRTGYFCSD